MWLRPPGLRATKQSCRAVPRLIRECLALDLFMGSCHGGSVVNVPGVTPRAGRGGFEPTEAGAHLRGRAIADTKPELLLRRALHKHGLRYRLNRRIGRYRPDIVFPGGHTAVFVDGCLWHNCPLHGPKELRGPNAEAWRDKLAENRDRDERATRELRAQGWVVLRIWECEVKGNATAAAQRVESAIQDAREPDSATWAKSD